MGKDGEKGKEITLSRDPWILPLDHQYPSTDCSRRIYLAHCPELLRCLESSSLTYTICCSLLPVKTFSHVSTVVCSLIGNKSCSRQSTKVVQTHRCIKGPASFNYRFSCSWSSYNTLSASSNFIQLNSSSGLSPLVTSVTIFSSTNRSNTLHTVWFQRTW